MQCGASQLASGMDWKSRLQQAPHCRCSMTRCQVGKEPVFQTVDLLGEAREIFGRRLTGIPKEAVDGAQLRLRSATLQQGSGLTLSTLHGHGKCGAAMVAPGIH